jgi:hypothetical protein
MSNPYLLGAGRLYFDPLVSGVYQGERYLGQCPSFSINVEAERVQLFSSDGPTAEKLEDVVTQVNRSASITCHEVSVDNLALFFSGDVSTASQSSGTVTDEVHDDVVKGRYYQLGQSTSFPSGARSVSAVVVKDTTTPTPVTFVLNTDYTVDAELGRIYIVPGGGIANGTDLRISYTKAAKTWDAITSGNLASRQGRLRYIEDAARGTNRDFYFPAVDLSPNGEFAVKSRDSFAELSFQVEILKPSTGQAMYINGRPV